MSNLLSLLVRLHFAAAAVTRAAVFTPVLNLPQFAFNLSMENVEVIAATALCLQSLNNYVIAIKKKRRRRLQRWCPKSSPLHRMQTILAETYRQ